MSLYDKASLIFSGAAGAGNEEVAYNIKPVEKLKVDEYITNGGFDTDSDWTKSGSVTISGGKANFSASDTSYQAVFQDNIIEPGKTYKISVEADITKGSFVAGTNLDETSIFKGAEVRANGSGKYSTYYTALEGEHRVLFKRGDSPYDFTLDNISVREVEQKANDFSFVRASDLTATHEGADGLIKKTRENALQYTNDFSVSASDGGWVKGNSTVTSGQSGYDGTTNAWKLSSTVSTSFNNIEQRSSNVPGITDYGSKVSTFSVYLKKGNTDWARINLNGTGNIYFDLSGNGAVGTVSSSNLFGKIEKIGTSEWFRCSVTRLEGGTFSGVLVYVAASDGNLLASDHSESKHIFVQNAQLEYGLVATPYIDRTDSYSKSTAGIQEDEPRYDYSLDNALPPALLYEPERKNEVPNSEGVVETSHDVTLTVNHGIAPDGTRSSLKVAKDGDDANDRIFPISNDNVTLTNSVNYSISAFVKNIDCTGVTTLACRTDAGSNELFRQGFQWTGASLALTSTGASGTRTKAFVESYGNNWWRIGFTFTANSTAGNFELDIDRVNGSATTSIETWGWQLEKGSCVTSYIPTYGSAATRKTDTIPQYTPSKTNLDKYTFFAHSHSDRVASDNRAPRLKGDGNSALMGIFVNAAGKKQFFLYDNENNSTLSKATFGSFEAGDDTKYAFVVDNIALEAKLFIDGVLRETISLTERVDAKIVSVGNSDGNPDRIKSIMYFPEALEDGDVVSLTT